MHEAEAQEPNGQIINCGIGRSNYTYCATNSLMKIVEIAATICHILKRKCNKFDIGREYAQDPAGGAYSAPQTP